MTGEHPLDKKVRERAEAAKRQAAAADLEKRQADESRSRTEAAWPQDKLALDAAIKGWNERYTKHNLTRRMEYRGHPQLSGAVHRGEVVVTDSSSGSFRTLGVVVTPQGIVSVSLNGHAPENGSVGQMNIAAWTGLLDRLDDLLGP